MYTASYLSDFSVIHPSFYKHIPDGSHLYVNLSSADSPRQGARSPEASSTPISNQNTCYNRLTAPPRFSDDEGDETTSDISDEDLTNQERTERYLENGEHP